MKRGFPGGSVVKNPPCNAGDAGSIPDTGRFHVPQSNKAHVPQRLTQCSSAQELQLLKPARPGTLHHNEEKPLLATTTEKPVLHGGSTAKNEKINRTIYVY